MSYIAIILAAGKSTRMGVGGLQKAFYEIGGEKLIIHLLNSIIKTNPENIYIVINDLYSENQIDYIGNYIENAGVKYEFIYQKEQLGTGHAVKEATKVFSLSGEKKIIIFYADSPFISQDSIIKLLNELTGENSGVICSFKTDKENQYGRILVDNNNCVKDIIEYKDYKEQLEIQKINLCNGAVFAIKGFVLQELLPLIESKNEAKEYYLFDIIKFGEKDYIFKHLEISLNESSGANNFIELEYLEEIWQKEQRVYWMKNFIQILDKNTVYFGFNNKIGKGTKIAQNVVLKNNVEIGINVIIEANNIIGENVKIGDNTIIKSFCYISNTIIGDNCEIGPFANLFDNIIEKENIIGNFVEIKRSNIGLKNKIKHLSYIGDTKLGNINNIGAGAIICNYNGKMKNVTSIGNNNFIGSNSSLIAPLSIGNNNLIGAGSVMTKSVENDILIIERNEQKNFKKIK